MFHYVYMLISLNTKKHISYVGYSSNPKKRLIKHNKGKGAKFTRGKKWKLIYHEKYQTRREAMSRESYLKNNKKLRNFIKNKYK